MGAIADFVEEFRCSRQHYLKIEESLGLQIKALFRDNIRSNEYIWQSRVKEVASLEKKLRKRNHEYKNDESRDVREIMDVIGGMIILVRQTDFHKVEEIIKRNFTVEHRSQHPQWGLGSDQRFRGYNGLHLYITRGDRSYVKCSNHFIEIQIMSPFMWAFSALGHDVEYKQARGEPTESTKSILEMIKGIAQLGQLATQQLDRSLNAGLQKLVPGRDNTGLNVRDAVQNLIHSSANEVQRLEEEDKQCLRVLRVTDPRDDKSRIEESKDHLLEGSCSWVFEDNAFVDWWADDGSNFLWIHGDPGKGKTMIMMAIISEGSSRLYRLPGSNLLAYLFCQNTDANLNSSISLLRGLIFLLIDQEKTLIRHLRKTYDTAGTRLFEGENANHALRRVLVDILRDDRLGNVFLMVDALDECDAQVLQLVDWIVHPDSGIPQKVKWLVTSSNQPDFVERLGNDETMHTSLELNAIHVAAAVDSFIDHKVKELAARKNYAPDLTKTTKGYLREKAENTFLWVALVCKELQQVKAHRVQSLLRKIPQGLTSLYQRMLRQVIHQKDQEDATLCRKLLCLVIISRRPLQLDEIPFLAQFPEDVRGDQSIRDIVSLCGSFLIIQSRTVYYVHQSATDFFASDEGDLVFQRDRRVEHHRLVRSCLILMSNCLRRNIFQLETTMCPVLAPDQMDRFIPRHIQYACRYWTAHFAEGNMNELAPEIYGFLRKSYIHWLEALSGVEQDQTKLKLLMSFADFRVRDRP